jgi:hypothetical protein
VTYARDVRRIRAWSVGLAIAFGSTLVTLVLLELAFRVAGVGAPSFAPPKKTMWPPRASRDRFSLPPGANARTVYASNPRGYFDARNGIDHRHNSAGWRDAERTVAKPAGVYRLLGLGDSYLWGQGVKPEDISLTRLEAMLNAAMATGGEPPVRIEAINAGLSGSNTADQRDLLLDRGLRYSPDLVIVHFVPNDVEPDVRRRGPKIEFFKEYGEVALEDDWLSHYSNLWAWTRRRWINRIRSDAYIRECVATFSEGSEKWRQCRAALDEIHAVCRARKIPLLVVIFPFFYELDEGYPFQPIHDVVRAHCEQRGIPVLDLQPRYRGFSGPELWVHPTDQHPNEVAHAIAARAIFEFLIGNRRTFGLPSQATLVTGGPTFTQALLPGRPAFHVFTKPASCEKPDQRGVRRSVPCDFGAYEAP